MSTTPKRLSVDEKIERYEKLLKEAKAEIVGIGILIEKSFQPGRARLEEQGMEVYSLARIKSMTEGKIEFLGE